MTDFALVGGMSAEIVEMGFTNVRQYNTYPQSQLHTKWPGAGVRGDPTFDQFLQSFIPYTTSYNSQESGMRLAGCELLSLIGGKSFVISHSLGSRYPILWSNDCPQYLAGSINIEPATTPFWTYGMGLGGRRANFWGLTNTAIDYEPAIDSSAMLATKVEASGNDSLGLRQCYRQKEPSSKLPKISSVPYLMITGEASVHITYDHCTIAYLKQVGGKPEWIKLGDINIRGNGHFMHLESNNLEIAEVVHRWIRKRL